VLNDHVDLGAFPHFDREMTGLHESQSRPGCVILACWGLQLWAFRLRRRPDGRTPGIGFLLFMKVCFQPPSTSTAVRLFTRSQ
jgi:hypothetical protein